MIIEYTVVCSRNIFSEPSDYATFFPFQFHLMLSEDGSGKGAALVAAVAERMANEGKTVA